MRHLLSLVLLCAMALASSQGFAAGRAASQLGQDARAEGLGGLSANLESGALSLHANPAALAGLDAAEIAFTHQSWLGDTHQEDLAWGLPLGSSSAVGIQGSWFGVPAFDSTGGAEAAADASLMSFNAGAAQRFKILGGLRFGLSLSYLQQSLDGTKQQDLSLNSGLMLGTPYQPLSLGVALRQLGLWKQADAGLPTQVVVGGALDYGFLMLGVDGELPTYGVPSKLRAGVEWRLHPSLSLRAGLSGDEAPDQAWAPDLGLGVKLGRLQVDLASTGHGSLGNTYSATIRVGFGPAPTPAPTATPVPTATPEPSPVATPEPRPKLKAAFVDDGEGNWDGGDFELDATVQGEMVRLNWPDLVKSLPGATGYEAFIALVPHTKMKSLGKGLQTDSNWAGEMGMSGITYYFRVKVYGAGGTVLAVSRIKSVLMP